MRRFGVGVGRHDDALDVLGQLSLCHIVGADGNVWRHGLDICMASKKREPVSANGLHAAVLSGDAL